MRIFHTSDWHLGAKLHEQSREEEQKAFLDWLITEMKERKPDLLLVAGDIFDTGSPSASAETLYHNFLSKVHKETECRKVLLVRGNHDSPCQLGITRQILEGMNISVIPAMSDDPAKECLYLEKDGKIEVAVAAIPFLSEGDAADLVRTKNETRSREELFRAGYIKHCEDVMACIRAKAPDVPVIMTGHCYIKGALISDDTSERSRHAQAVGGLDGLDAASLPSVAYLALGHLHNHQKVAGQNHIRYSGAPLPMSFSENCDKKIVEIEISRDNPEPVINEIPIPPFCAVERLEGSKEEIEEKLFPLLDAEIRTYVEIKVTKGEGSLEAWRKRIEGFWTGNKLLTVAARDEREKADLGSGLASIKGESLKTQEPLEIAERRLREENFNEDEIKTYLSMVDECIKAANNPEVNEIEGEKE